jgi:hypothetical protein
MRNPSHFNTGRTYPGRWTTTFSNPPINMLVPETRRVSLIGNSPP